MRRRGGKWSDCVVGVLLLMLLFTFTLAQVSNVIEVSNRVKCASNLRMIGQALLLYANENRGAYPRTIADNIKNPMPTWGTPYEGTDKLSADAKADPFDTKKGIVVPK